MSASIRKLIGTILILVFLAVYALVVAVLSYPILKDASKLSEFLFYMIAGLAWVLPAGVIIKWMAKADAPGS